MGVTAHIASTSTERVRLNGEPLISLHEAGRALPPTSRGSTIQPKTVGKWIARGLRVNGRVVKLEGVRVGERWATSREALARFCQRLTAAQEATSAS